MTVKQPDLYLKLRFQHSGGFVHLFAVPTWWSTELNRWEYSYVYSTHYSELDGLRVWSQGNYTWTQGLEDRGLYAHEVEFHGCNVTRSSQATAMAKILKRVEDSLHRQQTELGSVVDWPDYLGRVARALRCKGFRGLKGGEDFFDPCPIGDGVSNARWLMRILSDPTEENPSGIGRVEEMLGYREQRVLR